MYADDLRCSRVVSVSLESLGAALVFFSLVGGCSLRIASSAKMGAPSGLKSAKLPESDFAKTGGLLMMMLH
jgi:hypothetical protein